MANVDVIAVVDTALAVGDALLGRYVDEIRYCFGYSCYHSRYLAVRHCDVNNAYYQVDWQR